MNLDTKIILVFKNDKGETAKVETIISELAENHISYFQENLDDFLDCSCFNEGQNHCECTPQYDNYEFKELLIKPTIDKSILKKAVDKWGVPAQIDKVQEEAMELALALHQIKCPTKEKTIAEDNIYSELADMKIMCGYFNLLFDQDRINEQVEFKMNRLNDYLKEE